MTRRQKRIALLVSIACVAGVSFALVGAALDRSISYFYSPADIAALSAAPRGLIRLGGLVETGSISFDPGQKARVAFIVEDEIAKTPVVFEGVLPDLFREGQGVVVQGELDPSGTLIATEVLAKHDENYMPKEVSDALKKQGRWKESGSYREESGEGGPN